MRSIVYYLTLLDLVCVLGSVPQATEIGGNYFEKFHLDYGKEDKTRNAGSLRGFISTGKIASAPESDPFLKWWNQYLENGPEPMSDRVKPFYAADFGTMADLEKGHNPKIFIVRRLLTSDSRGEISCTNEIDVETREIWQPWLRSRCNFAVRYIVPNRVNIIRILQEKGQFHSEVSLEDDNKLYAKMIFKPTIAERLRGKRDRVLRRQLSGDILFNENTRAKARGVGKVSSTSKSLTAGSKAGQSFSDFASASSTLTAPMNRFSIEASTIFKKIDQKLQDYKEALAEKLAKIVRK